MSESQSQPGLISGHTQWVKGAAVETIGSVSGSEEWQKSGADQKQAGIDEMKAAGEQRDSSGGGRFEELAGKAVGCEGMEREGAQTKNPES